MCPTVPRQHTPASMAAIACRPMPPSSRHAALDSIRSSRSSANMSRLLVCVVEPRVAPHARADVPARRRILLPRLSPKRQRPQPHRRTHRRLRTLVRLDVPHRVVQAEQLHALQQQPLLVRERVAHHRTPFRVCVADLVPAWPQSDPGATPCVTLRPNRDHVTYRPPTSRADRTGPARRPARVGRSPVPTLPPVLPARLPHRVHACSTGHDRHDNSQNDHATLTSTPAPASQNASSPRSRASVPACSTGTTSTTSSQSVPVSPSVHQPTYPEPTRRASARTLAHPAHTSPGSAPGANVTDGTTPPTTPPADRKAGCSRPTSHVPPCRARAMRRANSRASDPTMIIHPSRCVCVTVTRANRAQRPTS